jgi:hypothetical protein
MMVSFSHRRQAAFVDVDAQSGTLLVNEQTPREIIANVEAGVGSAAPGQEKE